MIKRRFSGRRCFEGCFSLNLWIEHMGHSPQAPLQTVGLDSSPFKKYEKLCNLRSRTESGSPRLHRFSFIYSTFSYQYSGYFS